jgi:hypothetical protein
VQQRRKADHVMDNKYILDNQRDEQIKVPKYKGEKNSGRPGGVDGLSCDVCDSCNACDSLFFFFFFLKVRAAQREAWKRKFDRKWARKEFAIVMAARDKKRAWIKNRGESRLMVR